MNCLSMMSIPRKGGYGRIDRVSVPCGKCSSCLSNKRQSWAVRLSEEMKVSSNHRFITLTYNDDNNTGSVSKTDVQLFLKRLRHYCSKVNPDLNQRYYIAGEYGTKGHRPHYHALLFNLPVLNELDLYDLIGKSWQKGHSYIGTVTERSISYVAKYLLKGSVIPEGCEDPFSLMSRKPGIGATYVQRMADWHKSDINRYYVPRGKNKTVMPRLYKEKLYTKDERLKQKEIITELADKKERDDMYKLGKSYFEDELLKKEDSQRKLKKLINENQKL